MKFNIKLLFAAISFAIFTCMPLPGNAAIKKTEGFVAQHQTAQLEMVLSKKEVEKHLGRKLTFKEKLLLKFTSARMDKQTKAERRHTNMASKPVGGRKSQIVALLLCIFLGLLGVHRFYLGYTGMGLIYLFTAGLFGIGWLIDLILLIIPNGLSPKGQDSYRG